MEDCYCNLEVDVNGEETFMVNKVIQFQIQSHFFFLSLILGFIIYGVKFMLLK